MATSGSITSGYYNYTAFYLDWQLQSQSVSNNTSTISWQAGVRSSGATPSWYSNAIKIYDSSKINGSSIGSGTYSNITIPNGTKYELKSGTKTISHSSDGSKSFSYNINGWLYSYGDISKSGSSSLPTIPRASTPTSNKSSYEITDGESITVYTNRASSSFTHTLQIYRFNGDSIWKQFTSVGSSQTFTLDSSDVSSICSIIPNSTSTDMVFRLRTYSGGSQIGVEDITRTFRIPSDEQNPIFSTISYKDTNATTVSITGNDQYTIFGKSTVEATVAVADKAVAQESATMAKYLFNLAGVSAEQPYSSDSDVVNDFGVIAYGGDQTLTVTAQDSRGKKTDATMNVTVVPYFNPDIVVDIERQNSFESTTNVSISGSANLISVGGVTKNDVDDTNGIQYRYREAGGTWGSWTNVASSFNTSTGEVTTTPFTLNLDNSKVFDFEFKITDVLSSSVREITLSRGISIFRIGTDGKLYYNEGQLQPVSVFKEATTGGLLAPGGQYGTHIVTALSEDTLVAVPDSGFEGQKMILRIKDDGNGPWEFYWNGSYREMSGVELPTTSINNKTLYIGIMFNDEDSCWDVLSVGVEA